MSPSPALVPSITTRKKLFMINVACIPWCFKQGVKGLISESLGGGGGGGGGKCFPRPPSVYGPGTTSTYFVDMCTTYVTHARNLEANLYVHAIHIGKKPNNNTHKVNFQSCTDTPLDPNYIHSHRCCIQYRSGKLCTYLDIDFLCSYVAHSIQLFAQLHIPVFYPEGLVPRPKLRDRQLLSSTFMYSSSLLSTHSLPLPLQFPIQCT